MTNQHKILVIEDNWANRELLKYLLEAHQYKVELACNGKEGLSLATAFNPDLIICDLQMPELNGFEVLKKLRADKKFENKPIIAVTALSMSSDESEALAAGFTAYIPKPIDPENFCSIISLYLPPPN